MSKDKGQGRKKLKLPRVTLAAMTSVKVYETIKALEYSMRGIEFGEVVLITHRKPLGLPDSITYKHTSRLDNIDCFNYKMVYELGDYIDTDYVLLIHYDGFVVHPEKWQDRFFDYDYIGAPWPVPRPGQRHCYHDIHGNLCRVGNSVSLRSKSCWNSQGRQGLYGKRTRTGSITKMFFCAV